MLVSHDSESLQLFLFALLTLLSVFDHVVGWAHKGLTFHEWKFYCIQLRIGDTTSCKEGTVHQKREGFLAERGSPVPEWNYAKLAAALFFHLHFLSDLLDTRYGCTFFQLPSMVLQVRLHKPFFPYVARFCLFHEEILSQTKINSFPISTFFLPFTSSYLHT